MSFEGARGFSIQNSEHTSALHTLTLAVPQKAEADGVLEKLFGLFETLSNRYRAGALNSGAAGGSETDTALAQACPRCWPCRSCSSSRPRPFWP